MRSKEQPKRISESIDGIPYERIVDVKKLVDSYIYDRTWLTRENANSLRSFTGLIGFISQEVLKRYALFSRGGFDEKQTNAHLRGDVHIHDLPYSRFVPYCAGWDIRLVLEKGLDLPDITAKPARHFSSALDHVVNFLMAAQHEWAGAQAMSYIDLYLAPFIRHDSLGPGDVGQQVQRAIFNLNFPSRIACQSPFTNFTFVLDSIDSILEQPAIVNGLKLGCLGDYIEEAMIIMHAFIENYRRGDGKGRPFTFPIPTIMITEKFDWNGRRWSVEGIDITHEIFELTAKRGTFYFLNCLNGYIDPESRFAMCCRLLLDREEMLKICMHQGGIWTVPESTGSIGVVTINLPRLGFLAKGDDDKLYELLERRLDLAREHLMQKREFLEKMLKAEDSLLPITKSYLGTLRFHFNTIGIVGMHECLMNLTSIPIWRGEGIKLAKRILKFILDKLKEYEDEDGVPYNLEQTPAESASYRLAMLDSKLFKEHIKRGEYCIQGHAGAYYYTNSTHVPYNVPMPLHEKIRVEAEFHPYFTGGCVTHIWLYEAPEPEALKRFLYRVFTRTKIAYLTITPTITVCLHCGKSWTGIYSKCPQCGHERSLEYYSRIVGYYRPVRNWNEGKRTEFFERVHYSLEGKEVIKPEEILKEGVAL